MILVLDSGKEADEPPSGSSHTDFLENRRERVVATEKPGFGSIAGKQVHPAW